jgi:hypothetical protein
MTDCAFIAITSFASVGAALAAIASVFLSWRGIQEQNKQSQKSREDFRLSLAADLAMKLEDRFDTKEQRKIRARASQALLTNSGLRETEDIFDFFETIGLLLRNGALYPDLAYNFFFHWINLYWIAGEGYIQTERNTSNTLWENFEFAFHTVCKIEQQRDPKSIDLKLTSSSNRIKDLLQDEINREAE